MDCNKEEAIRARGIAEKKMENRDFAGAKKFASKAQQLYPDLENIVQMVLVCDVHCSAENRNYGNEKDWYGILKVEPEADDVLIRKQYRKFALLLHPDKNKFPGAADAFKLIGEAQMVLLDPKRRTLYSSRHIPPGRSQVPMQHTSCQPDIRTHPWVRNNFNTSGFMKQQRPQSGVQTQATFWTICPSCSVKFQYYKTMLNKLLWCHVCKSSYTARELNASEAPSRTDRSQPISKKNDAANQDNAKVSPQGACMSAASKRTHEKKVADETVVRNQFVQSEVGLESNSNGNSESTCGKMNKEGLSGEHKKENRKRRKTSAGFGENCDSSMSSDIEEDKDFEDAHLPRQNSQCLSEQNRRRSTRSRQHITCYDDEHLSDEYEELNPSKRSKGVGHHPRTKDEVQKFTRAETHNGEEKKSKDSLSSEGSMQNTEPEAENANERVAVHGNDRGQTFELPSDIGLSTMTDPDTFECPDPDFSDFDKEKEESCFKVGQVWAAYDTVDAMPRFYAVIKKILSPAFKVDITWLELDPVDEDEAKWLSKGLPASCGRFRLGNSEDSLDPPMFSHLACERIGSSCHTLKIFPRAGETWAIFKDWDMKWYSHLESMKKYNYSFVEVLSDYVDGIGVLVAYLGKVKGFTCLFHHTATKLGERDPFLIPAKEIFRFSHRVPSFKMTGMERNDVPEGSFELDPASLPIEQVGTSVSSDVDVEPGNAHHDVACPKSPAKRVEQETPLSKSNGRFGDCPFSAMNVKPRGFLSPTDGVEVKLKSETVTYSVDLKERFEGNPHPADQRSVNSEENCVASVPNDVPEPVFHTFDAERSLEKFQVGQFWAIYSDEDANPRYYGQIRRIDPTPNFALHVAWLYACPPHKGIIQWHDKGMPIGCGMFKFQNRKLNKYPGTNAFSHQVGAEPLDKKGVYMIFPRAGEVWAVYKNWSAQLKFDKLEDFEYEIVEIHDVTDRFISVKFLVRENGFKTVYKPQVEGVANGTVKISVAEQLRFSHQIPAFRLTEERGGSLRGFLELDPEAMPVYLFCTD